ncbi:MAG TPA: hypothetical protein VFJ22_16995, partial [Dermatophilaceae bacterium]|nr:hypothetical protein [Dermatophilaceae bacterium]
MPPSIAAAAAPAAETTNSPTVASDAPHVNAGSSPATTATSRISSLATHPDDGAQQPPGEKWRITPTAGTSSPAPVPREQRRP